MLSTSTQTNSGSGHKSGRRKIPMPDMCMRLVLQYLRSRLSEDGRRAGVLSSTSLALLFALAAKQAAEQAIRSKYPGNTAVGNMVGGGRSGAWRAIKQLVDADLVDYDGVTYSVKLGNLADLAAMPQYTDFMDTEAGLTGEEISSPTQVESPQIESPVPSEVAPATSQEIAPTTTPAIEASVEPVVDFINVTAPPVETSGKKPKAEKAPKKAKDPAEVMTEEKSKLILSSFENLVGYWLYGPVVVGLHPSQWNAFPPSRTNWAPVSGLRGDFQNPEPAVCTPKNPSGGNPALTAFAWCLIQYARVNEGKSIEIKPVNFQKMSGQIGQLVGRVGFDRAVQVIREICGNWRAIRDRVSWMKDLVLDETVFGRQPILTQVDSHIAQIGTVTNSTISDEDKVLILSSKENAILFLNWGVAGVKQGHGTNLAPMAGNWTQFAQQWEENGESKSIQRPERWTIDQWCSWYWALVCNYDSHIGAALQMVFWNEDRTRKLYEAINSIISVRTPAQSYMFFKSLGENFGLIRKLLEERGLSGFTLNEATPLNKLVVEMNSELLTWSTEKLEDEYARVESSN